MGKVVPLASALNVSQEELYGSFATLTGVTGSTAEVATQMKAVLAGLMSPTDTMTKALESLGYANANVALESLGLQGTFDALLETVDGDTQAFAKMFSSVEAQTALLALAGAQADSFTEKTAAMYEVTGATDEAFAKQTNTLEYTIQMIKNLGNNFMTSVGRAILPTVKNVAEKLLPVIQEGLTNLEPVLSGIYSAASPIIDVFGNFIGGILPNFKNGLTRMTEIWGKLQPVLADLAEKLMPIFEEVFAEVCSLFETIAPTIGTFVDSLLPAFSALIEGLMPIIQVLVTAIAPILDMIGQLIVSLLPALTSLINFLVPIISGLAQVFSVVLAGAIEYLMPIVQNIMNVFIGLCDFIANVFTGNWSMAWENVKSIFGNAFNALISLAKMPINGVITIINGLVQGINSLGLTIPDWVPVLGGKSFNISIPELPLLASGGFTNGPSIAGEAGTEAVISFNNAYRDENLSYWAKAGRMLGVDESFISAFERKGTGSGGMNITFAPQITINSTGKSTEQDIIDALKDEEERFMQMLEDLMSRKDGESYGFSY